MAVSSFHRAVSCSALVLSRK